MAPVARPASCVSALCRMSAIRCGRVDEEADLSRKKGGHEQKMAYRLRVLASRPHDNVCRTGLALYGPLSSTRVLVHHLLAETTCYYERDVRIVESSEISPEHAR